MFCNGSPIDAQNVAQFGENCLECELRIMKTVKRLHYQGKIYGPI